MYNGNAEVVTVPGEYNGENVYYIGAQTFYRSKAKKIIFTASDEYAPVVVLNAVYDCDNLEEVDFYWNDNKNPSYTQTISAGFATYCDKLSKVVISGCDKYTSYENGVYYNSNPSANPNSWTLIKAWGTEWHQPSWCKDAGSYVLQYITTITKVYLNPVSSSASSLSCFLSPNLEAAYIDKSNPYFFDDNGVVYDKNKMKLAFYPQKKPESTYHFLDGYEYDNYYSSYIYGQYLYTIYVPKNFKILTSNGKTFLEYSQRGNKITTIYVQEGNSDIAELQSKYSSKSKIIVYQ